MSRKLLSFGLVLSLGATVITGCAGNSDKNNAVSSPVGSESPSTATASPSASASSVNGSKDYGDTGGLTLPLVDKPTTLTWIVPGDGKANTRMITEALEERTGITVDWQFIPEATYAEKLKVTVASGKLPDVFFGLTPAEIKKIGQQKGVVAINDYADQLPNFKRLYMEENDWVIKSYGDENGNMYIWPVHNLERDVNHGFMYRKDIFDKHNIPEWTDTEGFYQALKKLKEVYPDTYPFASKTTVGIFGDFAYGWGIGGMNYPIYYNETEKTWKFASTQPESKDMLDFMKKLYAEGLLDPEFITDTSESWASKMTTDRAFVTFDWIGRMEMFYNQVKDANPDFNLRYANPVGPTGNIRSKPLIDVSHGVTVANNENKEASLKLLDYLTSPSGSALMTLGIEGETFNFDANGNPVYPELSDLPSVDIVALTTRYGLWMPVAYVNPDRRSVYYSFTEKEQEAQDKMVSGNKFEPVDPVLNFTDEETATIAELQTSLRTAAEEFNTRYVLDKSYGDAQWEEWKTHADKIGAAKLVELFNAAQKRLDAAN